jgi:hypothetical protein
MRKMVLAVLAICGAGVAWATPSACVGGVSDAGGCSTVDQEFASLSLLSAPDVIGQSNPITYLYTYTGHNFNQFFSGAVCPPECHLTLSFAQPAQLAANLTNQTITLTTFTMSDGFVTWTESTPGINFGFGPPKVSTDASGNITGWDLEFVIGGNSQNMITRTNPPSIQTIDVSSNNGTGREALIQNSAGTWQVTIVTPEPSTFALLTIALVALAICRRSLRA